MQLYKYDSEIENIYRKISELDGEITKDLEEELDKLELGRREKIINTACYIKSLVIEEKAFSEEIKSLQARKSRISNQINFYKNYIIEHSECKKIKDTKVVVSFRKSKNVEIDDSLPISDDFCIIKKNPDKKKIKKYLESGGECSFAEIKIKQNVIIK